MKSLRNHLIALLISFGFLAGCGTSDPDEAGQDFDSKEQVQGGPSQQVEQSDPISFDVHIEELYGDWVLIGIGADRMGPGVAPYGEILFAFREDGRMSVATEGREELLENLSEIPTPFTQEETKLCSDDIVFQLQFKQECCQIIRLNEGRMSIEVSIEGGKIYKHFVKLDN